MRQDTLGVGEWIETSRARARLSVGRKGDEIGEVQLEPKTPAPAGVSREGVLRGERAMRELWWDELGLGSSEFWRMWTGAWSDTGPTQAR